MDIIIRHTEPADYKAIHEIMSQPKAISGTLKLPYPSEDMWRKRLLELPDNATALVAEMNSKVVASLGLYQEKIPRRRHVAHLGMAVHDHWQGRGVGTQILKVALNMADNWLNLKRIELCVFTDNIAALKLYENFGFEREGLLKSYAFRDGLYQDVFAMARLKD